MTRSAGDAGGATWPSDRGRPDEVELRVGALRKVLDRRGASAAILSHRWNVAWLTAGASTHVLQSTESSVASIVVTADSVRVITQNIEAARLAEEEVVGLPIDVEGVPWWEPDAVGAAASRLGDKRSLLDRDLEADLEPLRSVLSPFDQSRMAALGGVAAEGAVSALAGVTAGITEEEIAALVLASLPEVRVPVLLVAADDRIARYRHPLPGPKPVRNRVMLVLVAERWGLHVALTRILEIATPSAELVRRRDVVREVQRRMHAATRPGATLGDVLEVARGAYAEMGFDGEWQQHHQGGSIGYRARERIAIPRDPTPIRAGMAFAWNPSIAGVKAEETLILGSVAAVPITFS